MLMLASFSAVGFAQTYEDTLAFNDVTLRVRADTALKPQQIQTVAGWLEHLTGSMLLVHGSAPQPRLRIELETFGNGDRTIAFGQVMRGTTPGMRFFINPDRPLDSFLSDWTPYHEASHLFIPYPGQRDIWISEGLASYYQNVLRYRAGILTERDAWQKLVSGFNRARQDARHADFTLADLSEVLRERYAFMRVYWSGALYFLEVDMALRTESGGQQSLDTVLGKFSACCLRENRRWTGEEILSRLDALASVDIFIPLYKEYALTRAIPDFEPVLERAGVPVVGSEVLPLKSAPRHNLSGISPLPAE